MSINPNYPLFCQFCGSNEIKENIEDFAFICLKCERIVYLHSKPAVCAVIIRDNKVLLVRTKDKSSWDFPGGFLRYGESPEDGLKRELIEELNAKIKVERLFEALVDVFGSYSDRNLNLFYKVELISDKIMASSEIEEFKWFDINKLPAIAYKSTLEIISNGKKYKLFG